LNIHGPSLAAGAGIAATVAIAVFLVLEYQYAAEPELVAIPIPVDTATAGPPQMPQLTVSVLLENGSPVMGSESSPITLVEFGDYQCHFCNVFFHQTKDVIYDQYIKTGKVKMIFKDFNIIGPDSIDASHAAHCAGDQGMFWEYHDTLYNNWTGENNGWASYQNLEAFASNMAGLDLDRWTQCMLEKPFSQRILASNDDAHSLGLTGTPAFFIVGHDGKTTPLMGAKSFDEFAEVLDSKLDRAGHEG